MVAANDLPTLRRQLKIKAGIMKRLTKERILYETELADQKKKVDKLVADAGDEWDIKNGNRMLIESQTMIKDSSERMGKAVADLRDLLVIAAKEPELAESTELMQAQEALQEAST